MLKSILLGWVRVDWTSTIQHGQLVELDHQFGVFWLTGNYDTTLNNCFHQVVITDQLWKHLN